jgi:phosphoglycolate phosphatase
LYDERLLRTTRSYDGMLDALVAIRSLGVLAVLTNKPLSHSQTLLRALGLAPFFTSVIGGDGPFPRKPDPESLRHLMAMHSVPPERTILVGDSPVDALTARAAGTRFCLARYGFGAEGAAITAEAAVGLPGELPEVIAQLLTREV